MQGDAIVYVHGLWLSGQEAFLLRRRVESERGCDWHNFSYYSMWQTTAEITQALAGFVRGLGAARVHLVGHSYGAAMALEAACELGPKVQSLTLVEPVSFNLLRVEGRPEWTEIEKLGVAVISAV